MFEESLGQRANSVLARSSRHRIAAGSCGEVEVFSYTVEPPRVGKIGQLYAADLLGIGLSRNVHRNGTILGDRYLGGVLGNGDLGFEGVPGGGDDIALAIQVKSARASVSDLAIGKSDLEETRSLNNQIEFVSGRRKIALLE